MNNAIIESLSAPGAPFEFTEIEIHNQPCRIFKQTPQYLSQIYDVMLTHGDKVMAVFEEQVLTYSQAYQQSAQLAEHLASTHHIKAGSRVAIAMRNNPYWLLSFIAISSLGAIPVLINSRGKQDEISYCIQLTQCQLIVADTLTAPLIDEALPCITVSNLKLDNLTSSLPKCPRSWNDTAMILFTSGTTGRPKAAKLSHLGVLTALMTNQYSGAIIGAQMAKKYNIDLTTLAAMRPQACNLLMFPLFHISGCQAIFLTGLLQGAKLVMLPKWNVEQALRLMQQEKVTAFAGVPTMYWDILKSETLTQYDLSSLISISVAGQSTPLSLFNTILEAFPSVIVGCGYGMTETNGAISLIIGEDLLEAPNSVGKALVTTDIKLLKDDGNVVQQGERGEILVRGATVMQGYDNQVDANEKCFIDGWYKTGDIGYFDEKQRLHIVDRATEMIISSGENIYCAEVERALSQCDDVIEVVTFGMPDDRLGEKLIAFIRLHSSSNNSVGAILKQASEQLANYKLPAECYLIDFPLERNQSGKILKPAAKSYYQSRLLTSQ